VIRALVRARNEKEIKCPPDGLEWEISQMSDKASNLEKVMPPGSGIHWMQDMILCVVCAMIVGFFVWATDSAPPPDPKSPHAQDSYYNLLVQGFSEGHLYVKRDAPAALSQFADPYDPAVNAPFARALNDLSYFKGKLYLYFGVTPAVVLFWPYHLVTGRYLSEGSAIAILFAIGFAAVLGLMRGICRRYFPETNLWIVTFSVLVLGMALGLAISGSVYEGTGLTVSGSVYEIAETCGLALAMLALLGIWRAMHARPARQALWLLLASFGYGLAVGARPTLLFGAAILLVPVIQAWRERVGSGSWPRVIILFAAAVVPITLVGLGLMLYNDLRFGNPLEFGWHYQLNQTDQATTRQFSPHYIWFNFWFYFLQPFGLTAHFPFLKSIPLPSLPSGHYARIISACGAILTAYPLVLLALAVPLAWKGKPPQTVSSLRWFVFALVSLFITVSFTLCLFFATNIRYEWDFLPELLILSMIGFLGVERAVLQARREASMVRWGWCLLLMYSLVFSILLNIETHAKVDCREGIIFVRNNRFDDALGKYQKALAIWPDDADAHYGLAGILVEMGRPDAAIAEYQKTVEIAPDDAPARENLGYGLLKTGRADDAIVQFQKAVELEPASAEFRSGLAFCLSEMGRQDDAIVQYQKAVDLDPSSAAGHAYLGQAFEAKELLDQAIVQYEKVIELQPNAAQVYDRLGNVFLRQGQIAKAVEQWKLALHYAPNLTPAQVSLAWVMATCPDASLRDGTGAVALAGRANVLCNGKNPVVLRSLAAAFAENGKFADAVAAARQALQISQGNSSLTATIQEQLNDYKNHEPFRDQTLAPSVKK
jgi:tetratricopeptide (TPR) repeat protein